MAASKSVDIDTAYGDGLEVGITDFTLGNDAPVKLACIYDIGRDAMVAGLNRKQVLDLVRALLAIEKELGDE